MNWNHIRSFLAVADAGTLSEAAARLGQSQPTLGRHLDDLEAALGLSLFIRGRSGMQLTEAGLSLVSEARAMAQGADRFAVTAAGRSAGIEGPVRITASDVVATYLLPSILVALREAEPEIEIELVPSNAVQNLLARDADIALRMVRPAQNDLIARKVNEMALGAFASPFYLAHHGRPSTLEDLRAHRLVGFDRDDAILAALRDRGIALDRRAFAFRTDDQVAYWELVRAGAGIGFGARYLAGLHPAMEGLMPGLSVPSLPIWLTAHEELRTSLRIRRVMDFLTEALTALPLSR